MKKAKINPLSADHNKKVVLDEDEYSDSEPVELICPSCNTKPATAISSAKDVVVSTMKRIT